MNATRVIQHFQSPNTLTNFDEFKTAVECHLPPYATPSLMAMMKVFFRHRYGLSLIIGDIYANPSYFRCAGIFSHHEKSVSGTIILSAINRQVLRKVGVFPDRKKIPTSSKCITVVIKYQLGLGSFDNFSGIGWKDKQKSITFSSSSDPRSNIKRNRQPNYRRFMASVLSSMLKDDGKTAVE